MNAKKRKSSSSWIDPDDAPELTDDFFTKATPKVGNKIVSRENFRNAAEKAMRGRPPGTATKKSTTVRFDIDVLDAFKSTGKGWQSRMNDALRQWLKGHRPGR
jgi:uncharacterized protein (DUF4415 family)